MDEPRRETRKTAFRDLTLTKKNITILLLGCEGV
jgi:hypothetical protein